MTGGGTYVLAAGLAIALVLSMATAAALVRHGRISRTLAAKAIDRVVEDAFAPYDDPDPFERLDELDLANLESSMAVGPCLPRP